jgi:hypothetical protein
MRGRVGAILTAAALATCTGGPAAAAPAPDPQPGAEQSAPPPPRPGGFPTPEELGRLGGRPVPENLFTLDVRPVDEWRLAGPFPAQVGAAPWVGEGAWDALLQEVAQSRAGLVVPTEAMHCVARELGHFFLAKRGRPTESLRRFIMSRCHATVADVGFGYVDGEVGGASEEQLFAHWKDAVRSNLEHGVQGGPRTAGIWFGQQGGHAVALVAFGRRELLVEPFSPFATPEGRLEIRGEVLRPAINVSALVNRGRYGVAPCELSEDVSPPRFHFVCEVDRKDRAANISVTLTPPERLLSRAGLSVLAFPGEQTLDVYRAPRYVDASAVEDAGAVPGEFVRLLNRVRAQAGLGAVELDAAQSRAASELAPHFFAALFEQAPDLQADLVVLGMIAGWGVDGIVESGHFSAAWVVNSSDIGRLLSTALEYPVSREALLASDIDRVAVGSILERGEGAPALAAVFGTYALFSQTSHEEVARRVYDKLERDRRAGGLGPAARLEPIEGLCRRAAGAVQAGGDPADAMNALLRDSVDVLHAPVSGWVAEVRDLEALEFPQEYLTSPTLRVAVAVSHTKRNGEPWGRYVVMLVVSDPEAWGV